MINKDVVIIGGGSAGLSAAITLYKKGIKDILILERDKELGGILLQCIHNGFGLHTFQEELSGPSYAQRYIEALEEMGVQYQLNAMVTHIHEDKRVEYVSPVEGYQTIQAKVIILAMGCYERSRGAISIPGYRPSGIFTAGSAQRYLNMDGYLVGKRVFILGSGDIGLIMARRMTLEGAKVLGVAELMPYSAGLPRNMKQCLEDFSIPLYLSHTVTKIEGQDRLNGIVISEVDKDLKPIKGTEKHFDVDTLLLSVGLIPENRLSEEANIVLHPRTKGPEVNESYMSSVEGIFACGNGLHVHDLVDYVSKEGERAAEGAYRYLKGEIVTEESPIHTKNENGVGYVLPQRIDPRNIEKDIDLFFRVTKIGKNVKCVIKLNGKILLETKKLHVSPSEMEHVTLSKDLLMGEKGVLTLEVQE